MVVSVKHFILVIETHKTQFTTVFLHSKVLVSLEHLNITDFPGAPSSKKEVIPEERGALGFYLSRQAKAGGGFWLLSGLWPVWMAGSSIDAAHSHF